MNFIKELWGFRKGVLIQESDEAFLRIAFVGNLTYILR